MGVAIKMTCNDVTVLPEDGEQLLVVALSDGGDVPGEGQVAHWHMTYDVHLESCVIQVKKNPCSHVWQVK